jgi:thioredoxin 1
MLAVFFVLYYLGSRPTHLYGVEAKNVNVQEVTDASFEKEVLKSSTLVLVDFWSSWCTCCRPLASVVASMAGDYGDKLKVVRVNVEQNPAIPRRYSVVGLPAVLVFDKGKRIKKWVGNVSADTLKREMDALLKSRVKEVQ